MNKCLECGKEIEDGKWCDMPCKEKFILNNFSYPQCIKVFEEEEKHKKPIREKVLKEWKESGLSFVDYLLSKGDFKDVEVNLNE